MTDVSNPFSTVAIANAALAVGNDKQRLLLVAQKLPAGSAVDGALVENIPDDGTITTLCGEGSMGELMYNAARKLNKVVQFDAIFLEEAAGDTAAGAVTFSGSATEAGEITVYFGSERNFPVTVAVSSGTTADGFGLLLAASMAGVEGIPVTGVNVTGVVTILTKGKGTYGNDIGLKVEGSVAGITVVLTAMQLGATDPTLTGVFDVTGDNRYQGVVWPYPQDLTELTGFLDPRFNLDNAVLDGCGFTTVVDTNGNVTTLVAAENSENLVIFVDKIESTATHKGSAQLELPFVKSAMFASIRALRLTVDAAVSEFVITANGSQDAFGGPALASKPYFNTPFPDLPIIETGLGWTAPEIAAHLVNGAAVIGNNQSKTESITGQVPTTYKTDLGGNADVTFKYLNYRDTASASREYFANNIKARFAQTRLTNGDVVRGRDVANDLTIRTYLERLYLDLSGPDFVLVQAGEDAIQFFKDSIVINLDLSLGKATVQMTTPIVTQLRVILVTQKIAFEIGE